MSQERTPIAALLALILVARLMAAAQDDKPATVGAYSPVQAARGRTIVEEHCSACHGADLTGGEAPALVGNSFMLKWESRNVEAFFRKIRDTMPAGAVGSITEDEKLDAVAYLIQQNGFPQGTAELPHDADALAKIPMSGRAGAVTLRTGSMVRVTGCLSQGTGNAWTLTNASEPRAAGNADSGSTADTSQPGTRTVRLLNVFPDPSAHKGQKMEASGLLVVDAAGPGVNVLTLETLAPVCGQ